MKIRRLTLIFSSYTPLLRPRWPSSQAIQQQSWMKPQVEQRLLSRRHPTFCKPSNADIIIDDGELIRDGQAKGRFNNVRAVANHESWVATTRPR